MTEPAWKAVNQSGETLMRTSVIKLLGVSFGLAWALSHGGNVQAQSASNVLEEITVTAQRRAESLQDVPMTVNAFTGEDLTQMRITDAWDVAQLTPAFTASRTFLDVPVYTIRGVGFNAINLSSTSSVGVYVDEVTHAFAYMSKGLLFDLERVEVLKGPQGTLFGRNTTGGLVNYVTAKPTDEFAAGIDLTYGSYQTFDVEGYVSGPFTDSLRGRLAFRHENSTKGWQKSVTRDDRLGEKDKVALRGILELDASERFSARLTGSYWRDSSDTLAAQLVDFRPSAGSAAFADPLVIDSIPSSPGNADADWAPPYHQPYPSPGNRPDNELYGLVRPGLKEFDTGFASVALQLNYAMPNDIDLISTTSYQEVKRDNAYDADGSAREVGVFAEDSRVESFQQEIRFAGEYDKGAWTAGIFYSRDDMHDFNSGWFGDNSQVGLLRFLGAVLVPDLIDAGVLPGPLPYPVEEIGAGLRTNGNHSEQEGRSASVFAHADYEISDTLKFSGGLRYTEDKLEMVGCSIDYSGTFHPLAATSLGLVFGNYPIPFEPFGCTTVDSTNFLPILVEDTLKEDNLSWRANLQWSPSDDLMTYLSISQGYKSGVFSVISANLDSQTFPATQEKLLAYEVGLKGTAGSVRYSASAYYYDFEDKQIYAQVADPVFTTLERIVNIPESEVFGAEAELTFQATENLTMRLATAYTDSEIKRFNAFDEFGQATDFSGKSFTYTPEWEVAGNLVLDIPLAGRNLSLRSRIDGSWQSDTSGSFADLDGFEIDDYLLVNASVMLYPSSDKWGLTVWVDNVFDETYWHSSAVRIENVVRYMGMPRTYGVTLRYAF